MMLQIKLGSAECHSVKQDIITISYLRKFKKTFTFLSYFNLFKVCRKCKHVIICKDHGTTPTPSYKYYILLYYLYIETKQVDLNVKYLKIRTNLVLVKSCYILGVTWISSLNVNIHMNVLNQSSEVIIIYQILTIKWPLYPYCFIVKNNKTQTLRSNNNHLAAFTKVQVSPPPPPFLIGL